MRNIIIRVATGLALAAMIGAADAAVYGPQQQLPATTIDAFKAAPLLLLQQYSQPAELTARVRDLGASDPSTIPALVALLKSPEAKSQMSAIAAGLVQLARLAAARGDLQLGTDIATTVGTDNPDALQAYRIALGDVPTLATGGAGGGAGGGGTGGCGPITSNVSTGGSNSGATTFGALNYGTPTTTAGSTGFGAAGTGASVDVSPTQ